jgi:hypothetical protein
MSVKADTWPDEMKTRRFDTLVARCTRILESSAANKEFLPLRSRLIGQRPIEDETTQVALPLFEIPLCSCVWKSAGVKTKRREIFYGRRFAESVRDDFT